MKPNESPGLQPERTLLAWQRTLLAAGVTALVFIRMAATDPSLPMIGALALTITAACSIAAGTFARRRRCSSTLGCGDTMGNPIPVLISVNLAIAGICAIASLG